MSSCHTAAVWGPHMLHHGNASLRSVFCPKMTVLTWTELEMQSTRVQFSLKISWEIFKWSGSCFKEGRELQRKSSKKWMLGYKGTNQSTGAWFSIWRKPRNIWTGPNPSCENCRAEDAWECQCFEKQVESAAAAVSRWWPWWDFQPPALLVIPAKRTPTLYRPQVEVNQIQQTLTANKDFWTNPLLSVDHVAVQITGDAE